MTEEVLCIKTYDSAFEAELAKNCLEAGGIYASVSAGDAEGRKTGEAAEYRLMVASADLEKARAVLENEEEISRDPDRKDLEEARRQEEERQGAAREFDRMREDQLRAKAHSYGINAAAGLVSLVSGLALVAFFPNRDLAFRFSAACFLFAVIQYFVCRDAAGARRRLEAMGKKI